MKYKNDIDEKYMRTALILAEIGRGTTSPNPLVGAVIVKGGKVIGQGYHEKYGEPHAERNAIQDSSVPLKGSTLYVTLEPCCHTGKTLPCTDAIIESGISRVVIGTRDPNPKVSGKGIDILKSSGISIDEGVLEEQCRKINRIFFHYIKTGLPYMTMKYAMTMDGKIAASSGRSKWITGEAAREHVHIERSYNTAVMVGKGTVLKDDPMLTSRTDKGAGKNPVRIICDTGLSIPIDSNIVKTADSIPTIIATANEDEEKHKAYLDRGCQIINVAKQEDHLDLMQLMKILGEKKIDSILLEGGSELNWGMLKAGLVNRIMAYIAPGIFGGSQSKTPVGGAGISDPFERYDLGQPEITALGRDILLESEVISCLQE